MSTDKDNILKEFMSVQFLAYFVVTETTMEVMYHGLNEPLQLIPEYFAGLELPIGKSVMTGFIDETNALIFIDKVTLH